MKQTARLRFEKLENRRLLAANLPPSSNLDVSGDGRVTAVDALQIINVLDSELTESRHDTNSDGRVTANDALQVINYLSQASVSQGAVASTQSEPAPSASIAVDGEIRQRDIATLAINSITDLDLTTVQALQIDWGDGRVDEIAGAGIELPLSRLHSYFVSPSTRTVQVNALLNGGVVVPLQSETIEVVANSPEIVDRANQGFNAEIFENVGDLTAGSPIAARIDPTINFDFGSGSPDPRLAVVSDAFAARWEGNYLPDFTGTHTLFAKTSANDQVKVIVDGSTIIDTFGSATAVEQNAAATLTSGVPVAVTVEYVAGSGDSRIQVGLENEASFKTAFPSHQVTPVPPAVVINDGVLVEQFPTAAGATIAQLRATPEFIANTPDLGFEIEGVGNSLAYTEATTGIKATRTRGILTAPVSGPYVFQLTASDEAELWLSQGVTSDTSNLLASATAPSTPVGSIPVYLVAGQEYYIETLHTHDNAATAASLSVAWTRPDDVASGAQPIATDFLRPIVPQVTLHAEISQTYEPDFLAAGTRVRIARNDDFGRDLEVAYTLGGDAQDGIDYQSMSGTATIPAGQESVVVTLDPIEDAIAESTETVTMRLVADPSYQLDVESTRQVIHSIVAGELEPATQLIPQSLTALIVDPDFYQSANLSDPNDPSGTITPLSVTAPGLPFAGNGVDYNAVEIDVIQADPNQPFQTMIGYNLTATEVPDGTPMLASVWARNVSGDGSNGLIGLRVQRDGPNYDGAEDQFDVGEDWTLLLFPVTASYGGNDLDRGVEVRLGYKEQTIQLAGFSLLKFANVADLQAAPEMFHTFSGRNWDDAWRDQAAIDAATQRTNPVQITIVDAAGNPIEGAVVTVTTATPSLPVGSAAEPTLVVPALSDPPPSSADAIRYQNLLGKMFDSLTDEYAVQWSAWETESTRPVRFADWTREQDLLYRGHSAVWGELEDFPAPAGLLAGYNSEVATAGAAAGVAWLKNEILDHLGPVPSDNGVGPVESLAGTRADGQTPIVTWWDVINHPIDARAMWDIVGDNFMLDVINATRSVGHPDTQLAINEVNVLSASDDGYSDALFDLLEDLDTWSPGGRADYDIIGFQSHFNSSTLPKIDQIINKLERFEVFDRDLHITEFDLDALAIDRQTQADFTRDFYQTLAANENVTSASLWGFWAGDHWRESDGTDEQAALFNLDWTPRPNGQWLLDYTATSKTPPQFTTTSSGELQLNRSDGQLDVKIELPNGQVFQSSLNPSETEIQVGEIEVTLDFTTFDGESEVSRIGRNQVFGDDFIPVESGSEYVLSGEARSGDDAGDLYDPNNRQYFGFASYDVDQQLIFPWHVNKQSSAVDTVLVENLSPGDTVIHLEDVSGWQNGGHWWERMLAWYGYTNSQGYTYPDYTYTRNVDFRRSTGSWLPNSINITDNTIELATPWGGPEVTAGTAVRNTHTSPTYNYAALSGVPVPNEWTKYEAILTAEGTSGNQFRPGTAFIKPILLTNYQAPGGRTNQVQWKNIQVLPAAPIAFQSSQIIHLTTQLTQTLFHLESTVIAWSQTSGPAVTSLSSDANTLTIMLPAVPVSSELTFEAQVTDDLGVSQLELTLLVNP